MARMISKNKKTNSKNDKSNKSFKKPNKSSDKSNKSSERNKISDNVNKILDGYDNNEQESNKYESIMNLLKENGNLKQNDKTIKRQILMNKMEYCKAMLSINRKNKEDCESWLKFREMNINKNQFSIIHDGYRNMHEEIIRACLCNMKYFAKKYYKYRNLYYS